MLGALSLLIFLSMEAGPGDAASYLIDPEYGIDQIEQLREELGLNRPWFVRYTIWLKEFAGGNWGYSALDGASVKEMLMLRLPRTISLMASAIGVGILIGLGFGILTALKKGTVTDHTFTYLGLTGLAIPPFFTAILAIYIFALILGVLPIGGIAVEGGLAVQVKHMILPVGVLGIRYGAEIMRYARISMLDVLGKDYMKLAESKGLPVWRIVWFHGVRNALIPITTFLVLRLPSLIAGSVIIEQVFAWPGMGTLFISAVRAKDYPIVMAIALIVAAATLFASLLADILLAVIDPRVRFD